MRQRNIKNIGEKLALYSRFLVNEPEKYAGRWHEVFGNERPIYLEIGCGKGQFLSGCARAHAEANFIGVEGQSNVVLRTLEKAEAGQLENLRVFIAYVNDLSQYFGEGELAGIFLNFSDPWPKARHAKRRLTYYRRLENYRRALRPDGFIEFKTDNDELFAFTLEQIELAGMTVDEMTRELRYEEARTAAGGFGSAVATEYEDRFRAEGKNINYVRFR